MSNWTNSDIEVLLEDLRYELWENIKNQTEWFKEKEGEQEERGYVAKEGIEEILETVFANVKEKLWEQ